MFLKQKTHQLLKKKLKTVTQIKQVHIIKVSHNEETWHLDLIVSRVSVLTAVTNLNGTRDKFHEDGFYGLVRGDHLGMMQEGYIYCAIYF